MSICQNTLTWCASNSPTPPVNAVFQTFLRSTPETLTAFLVTGYGTTDNTNGAGVLRWGLMQTLAAGYTDNNTGFSHILAWTADIQSRSCKGDSGGPLVRGMLNYRVFHTGFASRGWDCNRSSGALSYSGTTGGQAGWLLKHVSDIRNALGLSFDCTINLGSPSWFACDNNGAIY